LGAETPRAHHGGSRLDFREVEGDRMTGAPVLFGTDGVRGIAGEYPLEKRFVRKLGAAAGAIYNQEVRGRRRFFLLGRDTRASGPWIAQTFAEGAANAGIQVLDAGVTSTPSLAYLVPKEQVMGGVMVSASHNPAEFNGIKLFSPLGTKCPDAWERLIEKRVSELIDPPKPRRALIRKDSKAIQDYLDFLKRSLPSKTSFKGLTLVVDCSNGSLSKIAPAFLRRLGVHVMAIGASPNGKNINAGWGSQHPEKMQAEIKRRKAHGGMAFDGDADRIILCDENGNILDGDYILACAIRCLKEDNRLAGNMAVVTVMANLGLMKALRSWGVQTVVTPVGDRFVSDKLEETGGVIGGEQSGHVIFHDLLPTGDGLLTGIQILSMLRRRHQPLSWIKSLFAKFPQVLENVRVREKRPLEECPGVWAEIERAKRELGDNGRVLVRYSGTEPLLRVMMEGPSKPKLVELSDCIIREARNALGAL
jgi:phosphoglucosamine mutase